MPLSREEELERLIRQQRSDDASDIQWPDANGQLWGGSIDAANSEGTEVSGQIGVVYDYEEGEQEIVTFFIRRHGSVLGFSQTQIHGTITAYKNGCKCDRCRRANADAQADYLGRIREREPWHGTIGGYTNHGCRCGRCTRAWRGYQRRQWRLKKALHLGRRTCACGCGKRFTPKRIDNVYATRKCAQRKWKRDRKAA